LQPAEAMPGDFNHNKRLSQLLLRMGREHILKLGVHRIEGRWRNAEIDDTRAEAMNKHKAAEIPVSRYQDSLVLRCEGKKFGVCGLGQANLGGCDHIVPNLPKQPGCHCVNVLVEKKSHWPDAT
jgi:hypothetical protein